MRIAVYEYRTPDLKEAPDLYLERGKPLDVPTNTKRELELIGKVNELSRELEKVKSDYAEDREFIDTLTAEIRELKGE